MDTCYYIGEDELPIRKREARALDANHTEGVITKTMERIDQAFDNAKAMLKGLGWYKPVDSASLEKPHIKQLAINEEMTCSEWKSVLETVRQELIDAKEADATKKVADKPTK